MMTAEDRYLSDASFAALVDIMYGYIEGALFTPSELREAAILAAIKYEMRRPMPDRIILAEKALDALAERDGARKR